MFSVASKEGQRQFVYSQWRLGKRGSEIVSQLVEIHGVNAISKSAVYRWIEEFNHGRTDVADDTANRGRPISPSTKALVQRVKDFLQENPRVTSRELADRLGSPKTSIHRILSEDLGMVKLTARWVPRLLTEEMKAARMMSCRENLELAQGAGGWDSFRPYVVTGDETWIPHFDPETKQQSKVWALKGSDSPVKAKRDQHCKKIMLTFFFDQEGPLTIDFLEPNSTINSDRYAETLTKLKFDIRNKRRTAMKPHLLLHDNARPHTAKKTLDHVNNLNFDLLSHPPYSPDLAPCDYAIFPLLKKHLRGRIFDHRDNLEGEVRRVLLYEIPRQAYADAINALFTRWTKCCRLRGDFVEKSSVNGGGDAV